MIEWMGREPAGTENHNERKAIRNSIRRSALAAGLVMAGSAGLASAADQPATVSIDRLSMEMALKAARRPSRPAVTRESGSG
jgi:hypothetical protein